MEAVYQNNRWSRGCSLNSPSYSIFHIFREAFRYWPRTRAVRPYPSHIWYQSVDNFRGDHFIWFLEILRVRTTKLLNIKWTWRWLRLNYKKECVQQRIHMRTLHGTCTHISTPHIKTVWVRFLGKYGMNQLRFKLILILVMFPSQWSHLNCCLCCSWCGLKIKLCDKNCPR